MPSPKNGEKLSALIVLGIVLGHLSRLDPQSSCRFHLLRSILRAGLHTRQ